MATTPCIATIMYAASIVSERQEHAFRGLRLKSLNLMIRCTSCCVLLRRLTTSTKQYINLSTILPSSSSSLWRMMSKKAFWSFMPSECRQFNVSVADLLQHSFLGARLSRKIGRIKSTRCGRASGSGRIKDGCRRGRDCSVNRKDVIY
ncbi:hypothetical protein C366_00967 [Cryptococcus neoformans Tu401-1]|nr:hypothetical protein C366_00967 [Cryptococcus neoformans var. grubii Tu401-1]OXM81416.1 hypothetical protein C364_00970 [Cryptococcus neoformans var. grubii Bt63]